MDHHWVGKVKFVKYHDEHGSYIIMDNQKWYIGPPQRSDQKLEDDWDWVLIIMVIIWTILFGTFLR